MTFHLPPLGRHLLALSLIAGLALVPAHAVTGHLRFASPVEGSLELNHVGGWQIQSPIPAGTSTLWDLPSGTYSAVFTPASGETSSHRTEVVIWDDLTSRIDFEENPRGLTVAALPDDARGAMLLLTSDLWRELPGSKEETLAALDTHTRWRPGVQLSGIDARIAAERREILAGPASALGASVVSISPQGAGGERWSLSLASPAGAGSAGASVSRWPRVAIGGETNSRSGKFLTTRMGLARMPILGTPARGQLSLQYHSLGDASPRPTEHVLPHNDALLVDLAGHVEIGSASARTLLGTRGAAAALEGGRWSLTGDVASRGWQRSHFLEEYRENETHAPYEETALFQSRAGLSYRPGRRSRGDVWFGYDRYLTWLGDGTYRKELERYSLFQGNGRADASGVYWSSGDDLEGTFPHLFDYFCRKFTSSLRGGVEARVARGGRAQFGLQGTAAFHTYRRYEHFTPTAAGTDSIKYLNAIHIGYDPTGYAAVDDLYGPGQASEGRGAIWARGLGGDRWQIEGALGAHWFSCDDSALVSLSEPLGGNAVLDAGDLRATDTHMGLEGRIGIRRHGGQGWSAWGLGYRTSYAPPLEALFSPRAFLDTTVREGVMGNPNLAPERETGIELGLSRPFAVAGRAGVLQAALYAAQIQDAITMTAGDLGLGAGTGSSLIPIYENGGELRRYGLHLEATSRRASDPIWIRVAYDLSRIESDQFEAPLLDGRWLYPDRPQGEYESAGYGGPIGGIRDGLGDSSLLEPGRFRPSNLDRPHQLSLAIVARSVNPKKPTDWADALTSGWTKAAIVRISSGRPFTQVLGQSEVLLPIGTGESDPAWETLVPEAERNGERMPASVTIDLALTRRVMLGTHAMDLSIEALNVLGIKNAQAVYRTSGLPDDDGCLGSAGCPDAVPADDALYLERMDDPRNYDRPFVLRVGVSVEVI